MCAEPSCLAGNIVLTGFLFPSRVWLALGLSQPLHEAGGIAPEEKPTVLVPNLLCAHPNLLPPDRPNPAPLQVLIFPFLAKLGFMETNNNGTPRPNFCLNNTSVETKVEWGLWMQEKKAIFTKSLRCLKFKIDYCKNFEITVKSCQTNWTLRIWLYL